MAARGTRVQASEPHQLRASISRISDVQNELSEPDVSQGIDAGHGALVQAHHNHASEMFAKAVSRR